MFFHLLHSVHLLSLQYLHVLDCDLLLNLLLEKFGFDLFDVLVFGVEYLVQVLAVVLVFQVVLYLLLALLLSLLLGYGMGYVVCRKFFLFVGYGLLLHSM